jgi:hypothetical protein
MVENVMQADTTNINRTIFRWQYQAVPCPGAGGLGFRGMGRGKKAAIKMNSTTKSRICTIRRNLFYVGLYLNILTDFELDCLAIFFYLFQ